jgi:hypothetical protein
MKKSLFTLAVSLLTATVFGQTNSVSEHVAAGSPKHLYNVHNPTSSAQSGMGETGSSGSQLYSQQGMCEPSPHRFTLGGKYTRAYLKPNANPSFSGNMGGAQLAYEYQRPDFFYGGFTFDWRYGHLHASNGKRKLQDFDVQERLGYTLQVDRFNALVTFFAGFGYRHLRHSIDLNGASSIKLYYNHFYIPVGVLKQFEIASCFSLGANVIWMAQVFPTVTISPPSSARWKIRRQFKNFLVELPLIFHLDDYVKNLSIILVPQFEIWQDGRSIARTSSGTSLGLPENTYIFWSGELNVKYAF